MADSAVKTVLSVCATTGSRLSDLVIKEGQLIFVQDKHRIALDYKGKRVFYNQIAEIATEEERAALIPESGMFYFVINSAVLWRYDTKWVQLTTPPQDVMFIGVGLPELGSTNTLYVNKNGGISIWDAEISGYITVADKSSAISNEEIAALFA